MKNKIFKGNSKEDVRSQFNEWHKEKKLTMPETSYKLISMGFEKFIGYDSQGKEIWELTANWP